MWYQLKVENCPQREVDELSDRLQESGAVSIMLTDKDDIAPILEPAPGATPLWPNVIIEALFTRPEEAQAARQSLQDNYAALVCTLDVLPDKEWDKAWMADYKPQPFGKKLWVCASWHTPPDPNAVNLILDPGLAFGTGTHPTTSLCLTWLDQHDLTNQQLIDYGCGSGILALAAIKLGASHVQAVDIDEQALTATYNNAQSNKIDLHSLSISTPEQLDTTVDIVIANILLLPLLALKERFFQLLKAQGTLVISGILEEQLTTLINDYQTHFTHQQTVVKEGWVLVAFTRNN